MVPGTKKVDRKSDFPETKAKVVSAAGGSQCLVALTAGKRKGKEVLEVVDTRSFGWCFNLEETIHRSQLHDLVASEWGG